MKSATRIHFHAPLTDITVRRYSVFMNIIEDYLKKTCKTVYRLSKDSGIPYSTMSDLCNGRTPLNKCSAETIYRLSGATGLSCDDIITSAYAITSSTVRLPFLGGEKETDVDIKIRDSVYFADFAYNGENYDVRLCHIDKEAVRYLKEIVQWEVSDMVSQINVDLLSRRVKGQDYEKR